MIFSLQQIPMENVCLKKCFEYRKKASEDQMMFVVGATQGKLFEDVRRIVPNHFLLVPGVGAQGGSLREVVEYGINNQCGLLVNSSRQIIYAGQDENFAALSREQALKVQEEMKSLLEMKSLI